MVRKTKERPKAFLGAALAIAGLASSVIGQISASKKAKQQEQLQIDEANKQSAANLTSSYANDYASTEEYKSRFAPTYAKGGGIKIDQSKRGTFKAQATRMNMGVQEAASTILQDDNKDKYSTIMRKKANFARNFAENGMKSNTVEPTIVSGGYAKPIAKDVFVLGGRKHSQGGIVIGKGNNSIEAEAGEVVKVDNKQMKILSAQPITNSGISPAAKVLANPSASTADNVFNQQESFKRSKMKCGGKHKFADGGSIKQPFENRDYKMFSKMQWEATKGNPSAKRMMSNNPETYRFTGKETGMRGEKLNMAGQIGTHFMSSMDNYAVPLLQNVKGELKYNNKPKPSKEDIKFDTPDEAAYFAEHYKEVAPMMRSKKFTRSGGATSTYAKGGKVAITPSPYYTDTDPRRTKFQRQALMTARPDSTSLDLVQPVTKSVASKYPSLRTDYTYKAGVDTSGMSDIESSLAKQAKTAKTMSTVADVANIAAPIISGVIGYATASKAKAPVAPSQFRAANLETTYNIKPQVESAKQQYADMSGEIDRNTASSAAALARKQRALNLTNQQISELYGQQTNIETQLRNQEAMNKQQVDAQNVQQANIYAQQTADFSNVRAVEKANALNAIIGGATAGVRDIQKRQDLMTRENQQIAAIASGDVNASIARQVQSGIFDSNPQQLMSIYRTATNPELRRLIATKLKMR